jgi:hypothetical protein
MDADGMYSVFRTVAAIVLISVLVVGVLLGAIVAFSVAGRF